MITSKEDFGKKNEKKYNFITAKVVCAHLHISVFVVKNILPKIDAGAKGDGVNGDRDAKAPKSPAFTDVMEEIYRKQPDVKIMLTLETNTG